MRFCYMLLLCKFVGHLKLQDPEVEVALARAEIKVCKYVVSVE